MLRKIIPLNGTWQLQPTNDEGVPSTWRHAVPVPAVVDSATPTYAWEDFKFHWHRRSFTLPEESELAFVVIEQAMFGTDVWLNGTYLGGDIACYTSQEYDARSALRVGENELTIRVGRREDLPPHSAVGKDQERTEWIPGIWGDVYLAQSGNPRIKLVQVIPHITAATVEVRVTVENLSSTLLSAQLMTNVREKKSGKHASSMQDRTLTLKPNGVASAVFHHHLDAMHLWSPDSPFLYECEAHVQRLDARTLTRQPAGDMCVTAFGMREFKVVDGDFFLNGKRIFLKGGNIAFHRFLSDADRGTLPWDSAWIKRILIDIPKAHNFNFFRNHLGHMYNRWYDIADEHGMLLQNEWMFWTTTGTKEQILKEFTRWLHDNWNHPSIIIWDALNECSDSVVQGEIVPEMKKLDPTRPWESVDFVEDHPYIYSLGPVLNNRTFGFTRALEEIERSLQPTVLNEFCWWWLDKDFHPSTLMKGVVERWLGPRWTTEQLVAHQSFLVTELVELFRRMRIDAIQPFVYLSNNAGPTAHWFVGNIKELRAKPIMAALKNAFSPFGVSVELWDRHFFTSELRRVRVFVFNDEWEVKEGTLRCGVVNEMGEWLFESQQRVCVPASEVLVVLVTIPFPSRAGAYRIRAEILRENTLVAYSEKPAHVCAPVQVMRSLQERLFAVLPRDDEVLTYLAEHGIRTCTLAEMKAKGAAALIVGEGMVFSAEYQSRLGAVTKFLESGKTMIVMEPEFGVSDEETINLALGLELRIRKREDKDKGGYDSFVFATDETHPLWRDIPAEHLKMFNGAYGGEVVSQHDVQPNREVHVLARCGLGLDIAAVFEVPYTRGRVIVSRLQCRGRLTHTSAPDHLYARRADPVLQRYLLNLLAYASDFSADEP